MCVDVKVREVPGLIPMRRRFSGVVTCFTGHYQWWGWSYNFGQAPW